MNIVVSDDWWKNLFDEIYLLTDARSVCDDQLTNQEVEFLEKTLDWSKSDPILDLCGGQGRHALALSRRGFTNVTVLDYSPYLIKLGQERAQREQLQTTFIQGDARATGLPDQSFQYILIMASSFGYFSNEAENIKILEESFRLLKPKGTLLLDLPNREYILKKFRPESTHQVNEDISVRRIRELGDDIIYSRELVISQQHGCIRDNAYCTRLYSPEKITHIMTDVGFSDISCQLDFMSRDGEGDFGCMTNRMVVLAKKLG
ncbi:MAG: class I SAM-dependent methyltransferase [candidate division KSB1 bacterium]|nr:class I SAM-dependent methyltransferase [candidate division KSB1 bacterium]